MSDIESPKNQSNASAFWVSGIAVVVSVGAIIVSVLNFQSSMETKFNNQTQAQQLQLLQNEVVKTQRTQSSELIYLVHLANMQLVIGHDPIAALKTLQFAQKQVPATQIAFSNLLNTDIAQLQSANTIDKNAIFSDIAALNQSIQALSAIPSAPVIKTEKTTPTDSNETNWRDRIVDQIKSIKNLFIIRQIKEPVTPLLDAQLEFAIKQNMYLQLSLAQWALMHHDEKVFQTSLQSVSNSLSTYFALTNETKPILDKITSLQKINIRPALPSLENTLMMLSQTDAGQLPQKPTQPQKQTVPDTKNNSAAPVQKNPPSVEI